MTSSILLVTLAAVRRPRRRLVPIYHFYCSADDATDELCVVVLAYPLDDSGQQACAVQVAKPGAVRRPAPGLTG